VSNESRLLEITVRSPAGSGTFTTLAPRQRLAAAPFSLATRGINVDADGNVQVLGAGAFGNDATFGLGGTWYPEYAHEYDFATIITDFSLSDFWSVYRCYATVDPDVPTPGLYVYALDAEIFVPPDQAGDFVVVNGAYGEAIHRGSGDVNFLAGLYGGGYLDGPGSCQVLTGVNANCYASAGGQVGSSNGIEVYSTVGANDGDTASVDNNAGVLIHSPYRYATATLNNNYGIYLFDQNVGQVESYAIYSEGGDVYFNGDLAVTGNISKGGGSFKIDHPLDPENKYLYHSFVESPDMKNIYDGVVETDEEGLADVVLPEWFTALNRDFRYQLTVIGQFAQAIVAEEIADNRFAIRTDLPNVKVSWQVTGIRQDAYAEANRIPVEVEKSDQARGAYLHPEAFAQSKDRGEKRSQVQREGRLQPRQLRKRAGAKIDGVQPGATSVVPGAQALPGHKADSRLDVSGSR